MARGTIGSVLALAASGLYGQVDVLTAQYDLNRTSSNTQEQTLTQANVNAAQFGKLFSRTVDAPFYASPLIATNLNIPGVGVRDVVYVATLGNTVYAFDADDPNAATAYWSVNVGTPYYRGCCYLGPTIGILGTPFIDRSTSTIYFTAIVQTSDVGLYLYALDLGTGALKFNAPQRISYTFGNGATQTEANLPGTASWLQRAGLLMVNNILYVGTSAVWEGDTIFSQDGFIQAFQANDLSVRISSFDTDLTGAGGGFWQAGRGIAADSSGNVYAAVNSGAYNPPTTFGNSVVKFGPGTLSVSDWFTPSDWSFLYSNNLDISADGVTLMPGTNLAFAGGKLGVIYLLNQNSMGGLQPASGNIPLQEFQASQGCGAQQCGQQLATAYWPNASTPYLYVWDIFDTLRAYPFDSGSQQFLTGSATAGTLLPSRAGGMTISSNGSTAGTGIVWAVTAAQDPYSTAVPGTLRAYNANDITQELYDSDQNSCRDSVGSFVKMSTPIVANGKVYVNTQSNVLPVYGLLSQLPPYSPPPGAVPETVNTNIPGPTVTVDGSAPCTGSPGFNWAPGSQHTLSTSSPQVGIPGTSPQAGAPGAQFVWTGWSDGGAISHTVAPTSATTYTAYFTTQYLLTSNVSPQASGSIASSPSSAAAYYNAGAAVQLTATPISGCTFVNWTGALTGTVNPQTVTMTAPQAVTANFQCNVPPPAAFVTGYASKPLRNDFNGWVGMEFTVGNNALSVSALGRIMVYGNTGTHQMMLVNASTGSNVTGGSVSISMPSGNAGQIAYTPLPSPVTLQPNTTYYLVSQEVASGDQWYDVGPISTTSDAAVSSAIFSSDGVTWLTMSTANTSYAPVSFLYTLGAPAQYLLSTSVSPQAGGSIAASPSSAGSVYASGASVQLTATPASGCTFVNWTGALTGAVNPQWVTMSGPQSVTANFQCSGPAAPSFLTGYALNGPSLREDFTGWVGMKLTVGANSLTVSALGRICVANNTMAHVVKFVNVSDGSDLTGASVSLNTAGCTAGQFVYGAINPVTLPAGASYYLVSQETYGGDQWYDEGTVSATNAAVVNSAVYSNGGSWLPIGPGNSSYVPPNFQYSVVLPAPITVTVQTSPAGSSFSVDGTTYTTAQTLEWASGSSHSIATASPQSPAGGAQDAWSSWSDGGAISHTVAPSSATTYTATFTTQYLLTSNVSPAGSGSIAASPSSTGGYYASGASVQLTATAASGCTLVSWSGTSNSSANPQIVTMSGPQTVTANFQCTTPPGSSFLTGYALNGPSLRNDFTGFVGMKLTAGSTPLTVSALGRICVANNSQTHTVEFVNASTGLVVSGASASVNMTGCTPGQFVYTSISPVTLSANTAYYLVSQETQGGDQWYDQGTVSSTTAASVNGSVYFYNGAWYPNGSANYSYVPPNFQYSTSTVTQYQLTTSVSPSGSGTVSASPSSSNGLYNSGSPVQLTATAASNCTFQNWTGTTSGTTNPITVTMSSAQTVTANFQCTTLSGTPFLTGYAANSLRDDFGGFVGMKLTVGSTPLTVSALGRICVANNSQIHTVEFVNASTGLVAASASVNMAGCTPGQFVYGAISSITLPAGSSYYLASQETQGGDQWYDQGAVSATKDAAVNSAVYFYDGIWYPVASANSSYVPPNFQYSVGGVSQYLLSAGVSPVGGGSIAASPSSAGGLYNSGAAVQLTATPASGCTFGGWTGALTGMSNPQTVTMSGPQTVTATFQCTAPASTSFLTGYALSGQPLRNDFTGWVGMKLTVGANPLTISSLGRICVANNAMTHVVKFVDASTASDVSGASATVNMAGCTTGQFVYGAISPITFPAGSSYYLVSQEAQGGDRWYDQGAVSATNAAAVNSSVYFFNGSWYPINSTNTSYVPPNFQY